MPKKDHERNGPFTRVLRHRDFGWPLAAPDGRADVSPLKMSPIMDQCNKRSPSRNNLITIIPRKLKRNPKYGDVSGDTCTMILEHIGQAFCMDREGSQTMRMWAA
ncbi:hypothetical protein GCM10027258_10470 [Amycolatopsis stemonae]